MNPDDAGDAIEIAGAMLIAAEPDRWLSPSILPKDRIIFDIIYIMRI